MAKLKNKPPEKCAYRHCNNEFRPRRELQRFCSEVCRKAYNYDVTRTSKKPRKRALRSVETLPGSGILASVEKHEKKVGKTVSYRGSVTLVQRCGIEVPSTTDITDEELRDIAGDIGRGLEETSTKALIWHPMARRLKP
jgi:hypothetical protein